MNYATKSKSELQALRARFLTALTNDRLNATNRANIETWVAEIESELLKAAPVAAAKPVKVTAAPAPTVRQMRNGTAPRNAADQDRLQWSMWS